MVFFRGRTANLGRLNRLDNNANRLGVSIVGRREKLLIKTGSRSGLVRTRSLALALFLGNGGVAVEEIDFLVFGN